MPCGADYGTGLSFWGEIFEVVMLACCGGSIPATSLGLNPRVGAYEGADTLGRGVINKPLEGDSSRLQSWPCGLVLITAATNYSSA